MEDEFDIQALRRQLREAAGVDRRKPPRRPAAEPLGPGLFEWAGLEDVPLPSDAGPADGPDWPPVVVPLSPANRARPFGRRLEPSPPPEPVRSVPDTFDLFAEPWVPPEAPESSELPESSGPRRSRLRRLQPLEAEMPETVADFADLPGPEEIAAAERAAEALREVLHRQRPAAPAVTHPAQALLLSLANTLLLERDQLEARIADQSVPLVLTPLRRRKGERDHVPLMTANDRG